MHNLLDTHQHLIYRDQASYSWTKDIKSQCSVIPMDDWSGIERQLTNEKSQNL